MPADDGGAGAASIGFRALDTTVTSVTSLKELGSVLRVNITDGRIPREIGKLKELKTLVLEAEGLVGGVPAELGNCRKLETLRLSRNALTSLPDEMGQLRALRVLYVARNNLTTLPDSLASLGALETFAVQFNRIEALPPGMGNLTRLTTLTAHENRISALPAGLARLERLERLALSSNPLNGTLFAGLGSLARLQRLLLDATGLLAVPPLAQLKGLTWLAVGGNRLTALPALPASLAQLDAGGNRLALLPGNRSWAALRALRRLDLSRNQLSAAALEPLAAAPWIETLDLSWNALGTVPRAVHEQSGLRGLSMAGCELQKDIASVQLLSSTSTKLRQLDLSHNAPLWPLPLWTPFRDLSVLLLSNTGLRAVGDIGALKKLNALSVAGNALTEMSGLTCLKELRWLDLSGNLFVTLPANLGLRLTNLELLAIQGNPFQCDRRLQAWYGPLTRLPNLRIENEDQTLCSNTNEFSGQPIYRLFFSADEPGGMPALSVIGLDSTSLTLSWSYSDGLGASDAAAETDADADADTADGNTGDGGGGGNNTIAAALSQAERPSNERRSLHDSSRGDIVDPYGAYVPAEDSNTGEVWPCDSLGYKLLAIDWPQLAFQVEWTPAAETGIKTASASLCTWRWSPLQLTELAPFSAYIVRMRALNVRWDVQMDAVGPEKWAARLSAGPYTLTQRVRTLEDVPGAPVALETVSTTEDAAWLRWTAPADTRGIVLGYELQCAETRQSAVFFPGNALVGTFGGLAPRGTWTFRLRARTSVGPGPWSQPATAKTLPPCPAGFQRQQTPYTCVALCPQGAYQPPPPVPGGAPGLCTQCPSDFPRTLGGQPGVRPEDCVVDVGFMQDVVQIPTRAAARGRAFGSTANSSSDVREDGGAAALPPAVAAGDGPVAAVIDGRAYTRAQGARRACAATVGTICEEPGTTVASVGLRQGYWRIGPLSLDVRRCPFQDYCAPEEQDDSSNETAHAAQGYWSQRYCSEHHRGVMCVSCEEGYAMRSGLTCGECTGSMVQRSWALMCVWLAAGAALIISPTLWVLYLVRRRERDERDERQEREQHDADAAARLSPRGFSPRRQLKARFSDLLEEAPAAAAVGGGAAAAAAAAAAGAGQHADAGAGVSPARSRRSRLSSAQLQTLMGRSDRYDLNELDRDIGGRPRRRCIPERLRRVLPVVGCKLRITLGFYQVMLQFCLTSGLGAKSYDLVASAVDLNLSAFFRSLSMGCVFAADFWTSLLVYTLYPALGISLMCLAAGLLVRPLWPRQLPSAVAEVTWLALQLCFVIYPGVSATVIRAFLYDKLPRFIDDAQPYYALRADYSIDFDSAASRRWRIYAGVMVVVYPIGVVLFFLGSVLFFEHTMRRRAQRRAIGETQLRVARAISFLPLPYTYSWWECYELLRKLALTSLYLLLHQVSERGSQLAFLFMAFAFIWVLKTLLPYRDWKDHVLAEGSLLLTFLLGCVPFIPDLPVDAAGGLVLAIAVAEAALFALVAGLQLREHFARKRRGVVTDKGRDGGSDDAADAQVADLATAASRRRTGANVDTDTDANAERRSLANSSAAASPRSLSASLGSPCSPGSPYSRPASIKCNGEERDELEAHQAQSAAARLQPQLHARYPLRRPPTLLSGPVLSRAHSAVAMRDPQLAEQGRQAQAPTPPASPTVSASPRRRSPRLSNAKD